VAENRFQRLLIDVPILLDTTRVTEERPVPSEVDPEREALYSAV
jgi:hypothetical protein